MAWPKALRASRPPVVARDGTVKPNYARKGCSSRAGMVARRKTTNRPVCRSCHSPGGTSPSGRRSCQVCRAHRTMNGQACALTLDLYERGRGCRAASAVRAVLVCEVGGPSLYRRSRCGAGGLIGAAAAHSSPGQASTRCRSKVGARGKLLRTVGPRCLARSSQGFRFRRLASRVRSGRGRRGGRSCARR
jgi:hypothetical protein